VITHSESETAAVGRNLAAHLQPGDIVLLYGDLGAGKTAFVRGLAEGLGIDPTDVSSPTFTIIQEYRGGRVPLLHVDLYRLESKEVADLGLDELGEGVVVAVEWADRLPSTPARATSVRIRDASNDAREVDVSA
jgi:tRNA threonylcarbamoyladenosine biosynthesis protein TsaE